MEGIRNRAYARFLFCALFSAGHVVAADFLKKEARANPFFPAETRLFSPAVFRPFINEERGLVSVDDIHGFFTWKRFYFRP